MYPQGIDPDKKAITKVTIIIAILKILKILIPPYVIFSKYII